MKPLFANILICIAIIFIIRFLFSETCKRFYKSLVNSQAETETLREKVEEQSICSRCQHTEGLISINSTLVCESCKSLELQKLKEGIKKLNSKDKRIIMLGKRMIIPFIMSSVMIWLIFWFTVSKDFTLDHYVNNEFWFSETIPLRGQLMINSILTLPVVVLLNVLYWKKLKKAFQK